MPDVARYEPRLALAAGMDGGDAYRMIIPALSGMLEPGGVGILEIGAGQAEMVSEIALSRGFAVSLRHDLAGIPRAISVLMPPG